MFGSSTPALPPVPQQTQAPALPPTPTFADSKSPEAAQQEARDSAVKDARTRAGLAGTNKTGGLGLTTKPNVKKKKLGQ